MADRYGLPARVGEALSGFAERQAELREMQLRFEFGYRLVLAMADLRDEFAEQRRQNVRRHRDRLEALEREHCANMSRLHARYAAEHVQNSTELELDRWRRRRLDEQRRGDGNGGPVSPPSPSVSAHTARLRRVDDGLSAKRAQVSVFKRRLRRALDDYATFAEGCDGRGVLPGCEPDALRKRLARVRKPMAKLNDDDDDDDKNTCETPAGTKPTRYTRIRIGVRTLPILVDPSTISGPLLILGQYP